MRVWVRMAWVAVIMPAFGAVGVARAQAPAGAYPSRAPMAQYRFPSEAAEVALARSAAPSPISADAEILVLGARGYETAAKGHSGFVCFVYRSWSNDYTSPEFWNPKARAPVCYNAPAARSVLPSYLLRTEWVMAGATKDEMLQRERAAYARHPAMQPERGAMAYMMRQVMAGMPAV